MSYGKDMTFAILNDVNASTIDRALAAMQILLRENSDALHKAKLEDDWGIVKRERSNMGRLYLAQEKLVRVKRENEKGK